jgi:protein O-GlcNAc transferase
MPENDPKMMTIQQALELAIQHQQAGRLSEAQTLYQQILSQQPNHARALHLSGKIAQQMGQLPTAEGLIRRAIAAGPPAAIFYYSLGTVLAAQGRLDDAAEAYRAALKLRPDYAEARNNLGVVMKQTGRFQEAIEEYRRALELKPDYAPAYNNLGNVLQALGRFEQAAMAYTQAIRIQPDYPDALNNLGIALYSQGRFQEAVVSYRKAIELKPDLAMAHDGLGNALLALGSKQEAIAAFQEALRLKPDLASAHNNLGGALYDLAQIDAGIGAYREAIRLKPDYYEAYNNMSQALKDQGRLTEALEACRKALKLNPDFVKGHSDLIFDLHYHPDFDAPAIQGELGQWRRAHAEKLKKLIQPLAHDPNPERPLRIGYVSGDFREHVVGWNLLPLFQEHHRESFEIYCYANSFRDDAITCRLRSCAAVWRNITNLNDQQAAQLIREDKIDILVDLALHTGGNRLLIFAQKPAPVQVTWLGYPGSTGLETIDYRFSDPYLDPPETDLDVYSEQTLRLPQTYWCYQPGGAAPETAPLPALEAGYITFGCLNNFAKVSPAAMDLWTQILHRIPQARLIVHSKPGSHLDGVRECFSHAGITSDRLEFIGELPWEQYMQTFGRIDISLDPFPYNGGITTCDSLYMGVPLVSLSGQTAVGRAGRSILSNVGLPELIAETPEEYVEIAVKLSSDLPRLAELRRTLRERMQASPLMDAPRFARNIEAAYRQMWRGYAEKVVSRK